MKVSIPMMLAGALISSICVAQPPPKDGGKDDRPPPHEVREGSPRGDRPDGPPRLGTGKPGPLEHMRNYLELVDRYTRMSNDPTATAIAAVITSTDILRLRGPQAVIEKLEKLLPETKNLAVARAIRLQLADFYRQTNQADKAVEQLDALIKDAPSQ